jgi:hypothetical protein
MNVAAVPERVGCARVEERATPRGAFRHHIGERGCRLGGLAQMTRDDFVFSTIIEDKITCVVPADETCAFEGE